MGGLERKRDSKIKEGCHQKWAQFGDLSDERGGFYIEDRFQGDPFVIPEMENRKKTWVAVGHDKVVGIVIYRDGQRFEKTDFPGFGVFR